MTDLIKAMNPTAPLPTEQAALAAAKISAVGMVIGAVHQAVGGWYASTPEAQAATSRLVEQVTGQPADPGQAQAGLAIAGVLVVLQLGLAVVQWLKPNSILPILFLILVIWALGGALLGLVMPAFAAGQPMWLTLFTVLTMIIAAITHIAGIRGASALGKLRQA